MEPTAGKRKREENDVESSSDHSSANGATSSNCELATQMMAEQMKKMQDQMVAMQKALETSQA